MSKTYRKGAVPRDPSSVPQFLDAELGRLERSFGDAQPSNTLQWLTAEPSKLYAGMEVLADGTNWNPGWGRGKYIRDPDNASWIWLGGDLVGAGASAVQSTDKTTQVTVNAPTGQIQLASGNLAAGAITRFSVANSFVEANDIVYIHRDQTGTNSTYDVWCDSVNNAGGTFAVCVQNVSAVDRDEQPILSFRIFKGGV